MKKGRKLAKYFYDWMGVLLLGVLTVLAVTGAWASGEQGEAMSEQTVSEQALREQAVTAAAESKPLIVVDAGHGGSDNGASSANGVQEAALNLKVAKLVEAGLKEAGFKVVMTRENENALAKDKRKDMQARREIMRAEGVAAIVSIHMNKFRDSSIKGPMAFYMQGSAEGEALAAVVIEQVCAAIGNPKRDANPGDYFVLRESAAAAVIVECGFLSNAEDELLLQDAAHQQKLADGIVAGIAAHFAGGVNASADPASAEPDAPVAAVEEDEIPLK